MPYLLLKTLEKAQWLRVLATLAEDPSSGPAPTCDSQPLLILVLGNPVPSSDLFIQ